MVAPTGYRIERIDKGSIRRYLVTGDPRVAGKQLPSVTTILNIIDKSGGLVPWARDTALAKVHSVLSEEEFHLRLRDAESMDSYQSAISEAVAEARRRPDEVKETAASFGDLTHRIISDLIRNRAPEIPVAHATVIANFATWLNNLNVTLDVSEFMVYSAEFLYAGSFDAVGRRPGESSVSIFDWKTANHLYDENALQVAAYAKAYEEMTGIHVDQAWVVRFGKDSPSFEARKVEDLDTAFNSFLSAKFLQQSLRAAIWDKKAMVKFNG